MAEDPIDTANRFFIGARGDEIVFLRPLHQRLTHQEALLVAAYLVSLVGDDTQWQRTLTAVQNA